MTRSRSIVAGMTDYTGVPLADILAHLEDWRAQLSSDRVALGIIRRRLLAFPDDWRARDGVEESEFFEDLFVRFIGDFERLLAELPKGVEARHVELVLQMYQSAKSEEERCVQFKREHHLDALRSPGRIQNILAEVYRLTREAVVDLKDLSNLVPRLRTYVGSGGVTAKPEASVANALELKPNFMGLGLNLNFIIDRWFRRRT